MIASDVRTPHVYDVTTMVVSDVLSLCENKELIDNIPPCKNGSTGKRYSGCLREEVLGMELEYPLRFELLNCREWLFPILPLHSQLHGTWSLYNLALNEINIHEPENRSAI